MSNVEYILRESSHSRARKLRPRDMAPLGLALNALNAIAQNLIQPRFRSGNFVIFLIPTPSPAQLFASTM
jgi:hypothetical protein